LPDEYDTPCVLDLLKKDEDELLEGLWDIYSDPYAYLPSEIANFKAKDEPLEAQNAAEFHRLSLVRCLLDALSKSLLFPDYIIRKLDVMKLSAELISRLLIGFPDGYLVCNSI